MQIHSHPRAAVLPNRLWQAMLQRLNPRMTLITTNDKIFELQAGETLLDGLERTGHEVEYQCRSGYCGACRTPLLAGKVHYAAVPLAFVSQGECLPCCCQPVGAIKLDIRKG